MRVSARVPHWAQVISSLYFSYPPLFFFILQFSVELTLTELDIASPVPMQPTHYNKHTKPDAWKRIAKAV